MGKCTGKSATHPVSSSLFSVNAELGIFLSVSQFVPPVGSSDHHTPDPLGESIGDSGRGSPRSLRTEAILRGTVTLRHAAAGAQAAGSVFRGQHGPRARPRCPATRMRKEGVRRAPAPGTRSRFPKRAPHGGAPVLPPSGRGWSPCCCCTRESVNKYVALLGNNVLSNFLFEEIL